MVLVPFLSQDANVPYAYGEDCSGKNAVSVADLGGTGLKFTKDFENSFLNFRDQFGRAEDRFHKKSIALVVRP